MLIIVYIWLGARNIYNKEYSQFDIKSLNYDDINTGDIFLLSYSAPESVYNQGITAMKFIHAAICSREGSNVYVIEFGNYFDKDVGFLKIPFSKWIKYNKSALIMVNKLQIKNDSKDKRDALSRKFNKFRNDNMTDNDFSFIDYIGRYLVPGTKYQHFNPDKTDYACYELVLNMMNDIGMLKLTSSTESYVTDDLIGMKKFDMSPEYSYDEYFIGDTNSLKFISD